MLGWKNFISRCSDSPLDRMTSRLSSGAESLISRRATGEASTTQPISEGRMANMSRFLGGNGIINLKTPAIARYAQTRNDADPRIVLSLCHGHFLAPKAEPTTAATPSPATNITAAPSMTNFEPENTLSDNKPSTAVETRLLRIPKATSQQRQKVENHSRSNTATRATSNPPAMKW
jgi:hypothetical protein